LIDIPKEALKALRIVVEHSGAFRQGIAGKLLDALKARYTD